MLIDGAPQLVRLTAQRHKYFVKVPCGAGLATRRFHTVCEARAKLIAPASYRFVADDNPALEQQLFDIAQAELEPEMPTHRATDDRCRKAMTVVQRFCIFHHAILPDHLDNVTMPVARIRTLLDSGWPTFTGRRIADTPVSASRHISYV
ncbi:hypothetical protein QFZ94_006746 [Paraburkholderia sp. JPY465]